MFDLRLIVAILLATATTAADAAFVQNEIESGEGYFQIQWEADEPVRLLESATPDFADARMLYTGADTARVISGKPDGIWYYRIESADTGRVLGQDLIVTVRHHPIGQAFAFFALGALVFAATLTLIRFGGRANRELS